MNIGENIPVPYVIDLYSPFQTTLNDYTLDLQVRFPAMMAVIAFIQCVPSSNEKESFRDLLPAVIRTLADAFRSSEESAQRALKHFIQLANEEPRSSGMQLADVVATMFDTGDATIIRCLKDLHPLFRNILNDDTIDLDMRISVMAAVISFIQRVPSPNEKERFQDILPGMTGTLTNALSSGGKAADVLKLFIELARNEPRFFRTQLVVVVGTMLDIAEDESWEEGTRHLALEFSITLVEAKERAPGMMKRLPLFISRCYAIVLKLFQDNVNDAPPDWHSAEFMNENDGESRSLCVAANYLKRFSLALGRNSVVHIVKDHLCAYLATREWKKRITALWALDYIRDHFKGMMKYRDQVMQMVLNCLQHPHPQVRAKACLINFILWTAFPRHIQEKYHNKVFLALIAAVDDVHPQVQVAAMSNICQFPGMDRAETLIPYVDGIVNKLLVLVQNDKHLVQREALAAMAAIAYCVPDQFRTYYDTVMPHMRTVLRNTDPEANLFLRTIAMVCISHVGMGVGKETFKDDAKQLLLQVMEVFTSLQGPEVKVDEHTTSLMLWACARVCMCIGKDFLPYMSTIMPIAVQHAQLEPAMTISPKSEYYRMHALEIWGNEEDVARPDVLQVKVRACSCLFIFALKLEEDFYPWISQVVSVFVPLLRFYSDKKIRFIATWALCALLNSDQLAVKKGTAQGGSLSDYVIQCLVEALHEQPMADYCAHILEALDGCLEISQPLVHERQLRRIVDEVKHVITESLNRKRKLKERAKLDDFDAEEEEMLREEKEHEDKILIQLCAILRKLIESLKAAFLPSFEELYSSYLIPMWGQDKTAQERCTPVDIFASLLRECPEAALKYSHAFLPLLLDAINDESPAVRKNALYAIGHYAEHEGSVFKPFVSEVISRIHVVTTHISAREPENEHAYHKAVSTLGKICQFHRGSIDSVEIIPAWLKCLPIEGDAVEAKVVHDQLCSMFKRSGTEILGSKYEHFPKVISVFAEVICAREDLATKETSKCMINLLRHFQQTVPPATWESAWSLLLPQQEMELASILSPEQDVNL